MQVTVRYFAAARAATGVESEDAEIPDDASIEDVLASLTARHGEQLARVLPACSLLLDEVAVHSRSARPAEGATIDVLPPFAGG
jgi:molybdopterin converting factor small subunit